MKKPLRTNRIISDLTAGAKVHGTETPARDAVYSALNSETDIERTWLLTEEGYRSLALIDLGSSKWMGLLISPDKGYLYLYEAEGALNVENGKAVGPTFSFVSQEDANDTSAQLLKWEVEENDVVANPSETATQDLTKIKIDGTAYNLKAGTEVYPNPILTENAVTLSTIRIGDGGYYRLPTINGQSEAGGDITGTWPADENFASVIWLEDNNYSGWKYALSGGRVCEINPAAFSLDADSGEYMTDIADTHGGSGLVAILYNAGRHGAVWDNQYLSSNTLTFPALIDASLGATTATLPSTAYITLSTMSETWTFNKGGDLEVEITIYLSTFSASLKISMGGNDVTAAWLSNQLATALGAPLELTLKAAYIRSCAIVDWSTHNFDV